MITKAHFVKQMEPIDVMTLPGDFNGIADQLNIKRDRMGFALFHHGLLPFASPRVVPRIYRTDEKQPYTLDRICTHSSLNTVPMLFDQAAAFIIGYVELLRKTGMHAHTMWIPARDTYSCSIVFRLYFRADETFELFAYKRDDPSLWEGGEAYLVAYHALGM